MQPKSKISTGGNHEYHVELDPSKTPCHSFKLLNNIV